MRGKYTNAYPAGRIARRMRARYHRRLPISPATLSEFTRLAAYAVFLCSYLVFALGKFPGMKIDRAGVPITVATLALGWLWLTLIR